MTRGRLPSLFEEGDALVMITLDRLARSMRDLLGIVDRLKAKGAGLRLLGNLDTTTATRQQMLNVFGAVATLKAAQA